MSQQHRFTRLIAELRRLPAFQPDPAWRSTAKRRLMAMAAHLPAWPMRRWAVLATYETAPIGFANSIMARGDGWRPLAVNPERLLPAVRAIHPQLVLIDARLPGARSLERRVQGCTMAETGLARPQPR